MHFNVHRAAIVCAALFTMPLVSCRREEPKPPSQAAVEQAWSRADQAVQQAAEAEQQTQHERRLRDIDRLRTQADQADVLSQVSIIRAVAIAESAVLLALALWLAIEIRRRRVLSAALHALIPERR